MEQEIASKQFYSEVLNKEEHMKNSTVFAINLIYSTLRSYR